MAKQTEVYLCTFVPKKIPLFVDPHITVDGRNYIIEVDPEHQHIKAAHLIGQTTIDLLKSAGVKNPQLIYKGERPNF